MPRPPSAPSTPEYIRAHIENRLKYWLTAAATAAAETDPGYGHLWDVISAQLLGGGKRLRPFLTVLSYQTFGGRSQAIYDVGAAQEFLHGALLMHDDVIDRDYVRHGHPNLAGEYAATYGGRLGGDHMAAGAAILAGDLLIAQAHACIAGSAFSAPRRAIAGNILGRQIHEAVAGELLDIEAAGRAQTPAQAIKIARLKTAGYSVTGPLIMGAHLAGAPPQALAQLEDLGAALGTGFQLADDLLGMFGDQSQTGKPATSDLREGKSTYLIQLALRLAPPSDRAWLLERWGRPGITQDDLKRARHIIESSGARAGVQVAIADSAQQAHAALVRLELSPQATAIFTDIISRALHRQT